MAAENPNFWLVARLRTCLLTLLIPALALIVVFGLLEAKPQAARAGGSQAGVQSLEGAIIYVDADATGLNTGSSWTNAFTTLHPALVLSQPGDEIWVAEGVYIPTWSATPTSTFILQPGVGLYGGFAGGETARSQRNWRTHITVLSGDLAGDDLTDAHEIVTDPADIIGANAYHVVSAFFLTETAVLDGFTITGGKSHPDDTRYTYGAGMFDWAGNPTLARLTFSGNQATYQGGGLAVVDSEELVLTDIQFLHNRAETGGGMFDMNSTIAITQAAFIDNYASYGGGGMWSRDSQIRLDTLIFDQNQAEYGGAIYSFGSIYNLRTASLNRNQASEQGGGAYGDNSEWQAVDLALRGNQAQEGGGFYGSGSLLQVENGLVTGNLASEDGAGLYDADGYTRLVNVTLSGNRALTSGGGLYLEGSDDLLVNAILWGNSAPSGAQAAYNPASASLTITHSIVQGGFAGPGNRSANPRFKLPVSASWAPDMTGDYHLLPGPAVDAGDNSILTVSTDLDGNPRVRNLRVDLGPYEGLFQWQFLPLLKR